MPRINSSTLENERREEGIQSTERLLSSMGVTLSQHADFVERDAEGRKDGRTGGAGAGSPIGTDV